MRSAQLVSLLGCAAAIACLGAVAHAKPSAKAAKRSTRKTSSHISSPGDAEDTPAVRYAQMSRDDCEAELASRGIDFVRETASGVVAPVRLTGALHGVMFRTDGKDAVRAVSPYEIADCRLVLALDDFAQVLASHGIVEVRHYSIYRPPHGWPEGKIGGQHNGALAIDAGRFIDSAGKVLNVDRDFHGAIGARTCGDGAGPRPSTPDPGARSISRQFIRITSSAKKSAKPGSRETTAS